VAIISMPTVNATLTNSAVNVPNGVDINNRDTTSYITNFPASQMVKQDSSSFSVNIEYANNVNSPVYTSQHNGDTWVFQNYFTSKTPAMYKSNDIANGSQALASNERITIIEVNVGGTSADTFGVYVSTINNTFTVRGGEPRSRLYIGNYKGATINWTKYGSPTFFEIDIDTIKE
jgi:hypothetical protein